MAAEVNGKNDPSALLKSALLKIKELKAKLKESESRASEPIAILGVGCRFPGGGAHPEAFFQALTEGVDGVRRIPEERWPTSAMAAARPELRWAGLLDAVDGFDAAFFGISPREASGLDPQQRLLLEVVWETLERAGERTDRLMGSRTGVFIGMSSIDYQHLVRRAGGFDAYSTTGSLLSTAAGRISYVLGLQGPCVTIDTACSSSLVAVHFACESLRRGEAELALVGGVNLLLEPATMEMAIETQALAPDGRSKAFDARANGFVRGEGCGVVVLKRLSDASRDGSPILALIRGSAVNQDGRSAGLTAPNVLSQQALLMQALSNAGVSPADIGYVETHGTGTSLGDPIEFEALKAVLGAPRGDGSRCVLGALKTNVGHLEAAAGVAGLIKAILCTERGEIPRNLHFRSLNPRISLEGTPFVIPTENIPWQSHDKPRRAGVSSFGISGTNAHVILEEAPQRETVERAVKEASSYLVPLSAKSPEALLALAHRYHEWLMNNDGCFSSLHDIAYTASARRSHHEHRLGVVGTSKEQIAAALAAAGRGETPSGLSRGRATESAPKVVFVFPGQGSQWVGMGRTLLEEEPAFREAILACDDAIRGEAGFSVIEELRADEERSRLSEIDVVQPVLFAVEVALAALWRSWGIEPSFVVGHSMGEAAAAYVSGALTLGDAVAVICRRSLLLRRVSGKGAMALVELPMADAEKALATYADRLSVAVSNGPRSTVLAGDPAALEEVLAKLEREQVFCRRVKVDVASHSPQMDPLRAELLAALAGLSPKKASLPMRSTVTAERLSGDELLAGYWADNLRKPVLFSRVTRELIAEGHTLFLEMSPHPLLLPSVEENLREWKAEGAALASLRRQGDERRNLLESLGELYVHGCPVDWKRLYPEGGQVALLPSYPWQRERFWIKSSPEPREASRRAQRAGKDGSEHPLLGARLLSSSSSAHAWEQALSVETVPYLADHRVQGEVVFPGAGYVEMAVAAGAETLGTAEIVLENVTFEQMLALTATGERIAQVVLTGGDPGRYAFQIASRAEDTKEWTKHASGSVGLASGEVPGARVRETKEALKERLGAPRSTEEFYVRSNFGPAFQGLVELWADQGAALGRVRLPDEVKDTGYWLHPALLDACFHTSAGLLPSSVNSETYVLGGIERLHLHARPARRAWVVATWHAEDKTGLGEHTFDLRIVDDEDHLLVEIHGFRMKRLREGTARAADPLAGCVYEVVWSPAPPLPEPSLPPEGAWLVFCDHTGVGAALKGRLSTHQQRCVRVVAGASYAELEPDLYRIDPDRPDDYQRLLREAFDQERRCLGAVHLFSLDAAPTEDTTVETLDADLLRGSVSVTSLVQAIVQHGFRDAPRLVLVTRGAQVVLPGDPVSVAQAPLLGLGKTITIEHSALKCTSIDLSSTANEGDAELVLRQLAAKEREDQIALRGDGRYVARVVRSSFEPSETTESNLRIEPVLVRRNQAVTIRPARSYLITGGLGGLGLALARWLVEQGARHLVLVGRRGSTEEAQEAIRGMEEAGVKVLTLPVDVSRREEVERLFATLKEKMPTLAGIVHAAMVLEDHTLLEQSAESFRKVFAPKALGAWNLHTMTMREGRELDFFVLYSSAASLFGSPGQGNYVAANAFLDALSHERARRGLVSMSIQWGGFSDVGAAVQANRAPRLAVRGGASWSAAEGLLALQRLLERPRTQVGLLRSFDIRRWIEFYPATASLPLFAELMREAASSRDDEEAPRMRQSLLEAAPNERLPLLERHLIEHVATVLHLDPARIERSAPLQSLGVDSLMSLELRNRIEVSLGVRLSATLLYTYPNATVLAAHLLTMLDHSPAQPPEETESKSLQDEAQRERVQGVERMTEGETEEAIEAELDALEDYLR